MFSFAVLVYLILILWDSRFLRKENQKLYHSIFQIGQNVWLGSLLFIGLAIVFDPNWAASTTYFIFIFVFPIYFSKKGIFLKHIVGGKKFWVATRGIQVILYWLFGVLLFSMIIHEIGIYMKGFLGELEEMVAAAAFSSTLLVYLIERNARVFGEVDFLSSVGFSRERVSFIKKVFVPVLLGVAMAYFSATIITERSFQPTTPLSVALESDKSTWAIPLFVFLALIVAPFVEEITFRGYFFEVLKRVKGQRVAFYIIALTFGVLHMAQYWGDWAAISVIMIMGFWLTLVRVWSKTTTASVVMHYSYNIGVVFIVTVIEVSKELLG